MAEISEEMQNMVGQFQAYQQQLQSVLIQKENLKMQNMEIEKALEELNATKEMTAYKITGSIMVKRAVEEVKKELGETKEDVDVKIKSMEKMEEKINSKLKELQVKLKEKLK